MKLIAGIVLVALLIGGFIFLRSDPIPLEVGARIVSKADFSRYRYDGDTFALLSYPGQKIRLAGIDAPESRQECVRNTDKKTWKCGIAAGEALRTLIQDNRLICRITKKDFYPNRWNAVCEVGKIEINRWMVEQGWAMAAVKYSRQYVGDEQNAREAKRGIWNSTFRKPWEWRKSIQTRPD